MATQSALVPVEFHGATLSASIIDGAPCVAIRPIVEALGLDWASQFTRIKRHPVLSATVVVTTTVAEDGKNREMMFLPLSMLNGWLFGVSVNRVKPELRDKLIQYQRECFEVLADHFLPVQRPGIPVTLYEQALQVETKEAKSFALAQAGSRAMLLRKSEKKELVETVALMREAIQLRLALGYSTYA